MYCVPGIPEEIICIVSPEYPDHERPAAKEPVRQGQGFPQGGHRVAALMEDLARAENALASGSPDVIR